MPKIIREIIRNSVATALFPLEYYLLGERHVGYTPPPCFIIGSPRSGTTLLYEALTVRFDFSYFSSLSERFYKTPAASTYLGRGLLKRRAIGSFVSRYGQISGWMAPSEGGRIWNQWFPQSSYLSADHIASLPVDIIRNIVTSVSKSIDAPFLNKNVMHSVHIELLDKLFPGCIFIEIQRDPVANMRSIIKARINKGGPHMKKGWWSVKPTCWKQYRDASMEEQACVQVCRLREDIAKQIDKISSNRLLRVNYEQFCKVPENTMGQIKAFFKEQLEVKLIDKGTVPHQFTVSPSLPLKPKSEEAIKNCLANSYSDE
jgi:hypothetical protein